VVAGGLHTDYDPATIRVLAATGRLFSTENVDAVLPGEAAAFVLITRDETARRLDLTPMARIHGIGTETNNEAPDRAFDSGAIARAIRSATENLPDEIAIGWAVTHLGFEHAPVRELYSALTRTHKRFGPPLVVDAPAQRAGNLGAAALPLALGFMALAHRHGFAPAPFGLAIAGSDGGERAAMLVASA
jgi:3-oxoacyl-[acyl-carrier-protein] synthase-1